MTKSELNARLPVPLTASQLKKISLADLQARVDALRSESNHFGIDPDTDQVLDDSEYLTPRRKLKADGILFAARVDRKDPKPGSKRALLLDLLRAGTTIDEIAAALGWNRSAASSALYVDVRDMSGYGCERIDGRLFLLPRVN